MAGPLRSRARFCRRLAKPLREGGFMRRTTLASLVLVMAAFAAFAQDRAVGAESYAGTVALDQSIIELARFAGQSQASLDAFARGRAFLLVGSLSRPLVVSDDPPRSVIELSQGRWVGTSRIELFKLLLVADGEAFRALDGLTDGVRAVVLADRPMVGSGPDGEPAVLLRAISIQIIR